MRKVLVLLLVLCCQGCSPDTAKEQGAQDSALIAGHADEVFVFLRDSQQAYLEPTAFYYPLDSRDPVLLNHLVHPFHAPNRYLNVVLHGGARNREQLLSASLEKAGSCVDTLGKADFWEGAYAADRDIAWNDYGGNLGDWAYSRNADACLGAHISFVFFDQAAEKRRIVDFYRANHARQFAGKWGKDIERPGVDEAYALATGRYRASVNRELLPYFRQIEKSYISRCIDASPMETEYCEGAYANWDIKPFDG